MNRFLKSTALATVVALALACGGGDEPAPEPADDDADQVMFVPDSTIEREVTTRVEADPRLAEAEFDVRIAAAEGDVFLVGVVPSRYEMSLIREIALSAPGVRAVVLDSLRVLSEEQNEEPAGE